MEKILFVCSGNTCRSPFAAYYFNKLARERNMSALASSAGLFTYGGEKPCKSAIEAAKKFGVGEMMEVHRSSQLTPDMLTEFDVIIAMGNSHLEILNNAVTNGLPAKDGQKRILLGTGISDPFGGDVEQYTKCYLQIAKSIDAFTEANY